jgi:hypothetical protein
MFVDFVSPDDRRWKQVLERCAHDFYHLPAYLEFAAWHEGGTPVAFLAMDNDAFLLAPLLIQRIPSVLGGSSGWKDAKTPYGYPSPLFHSSSAGPTLHAFLTQFRQHCRELNIVTAFFRLHPLINLPVDVLQEYGEVVPRGETVSVALSAPLETIWGKVRTNHKRDVKKLKRDGFYACLDRWDHYETFITLYRQTMTRLNATGFYMFSDEYFLNLRRALDSHLHLITAHNPQGVVVAAGLFISTNGIVQYHLGATHEDYLRAAPSKLVFEYAIRSAKAEGSRVLHLGGGLGAKNDSLFHFKAGFSNSVHRFYTFHMILDGRKYAMLNTRWQEQGGKPDEDSCFFPSYRRPLVPVEEP